MGFIATPAYWLAFAVERAQEPTSQISNGAFAHCLDQKLTLTQGLLCEAPHNHVRMFLDRIGERSLRPLSRRASGTFGVSQRGEKSKSIKACVNAFSQRTVLFSFGSGRTTRFCRTLQRRTSCAASARSRKNPPCEQLLAPDAAASTTSRLAFVTIAIRPSCRDGTARK